MKRRRLLAPVVMVLFGSMQPGHSFVITLLPGSAYDPDPDIMDANVGIAGFAIEDFEDTTLVTGLSITYTSPDAGPVTTLPTVYNEAAIGNYTNNLWDGAHALVNTPQNQEWNQPGIGLASIAYRITFNILDGATSFGVGLGNFQSSLVDHELLINGDSVIPALETDPSWVAGISVRNAYLRIDAEAGEQIDSVSIDIGTGTRDGLVFDRLAFSPVPEPGVPLLAVAATCALVIFRGRRRT